jgi:hypothetical protein
MASRRRGGRAGFNIMTTFTPGRVCLGDETRHREATNLLKPRQRSGRLARGSSHQSTADERYVELVRGESGVCSSDGKNHASGFVSEPRCYAKEPLTGPLNANRLAKYSATLRRAAEEVWRATQNGDAPFEAGFSIDKNGHPGKVQLSQFATTNPATHLKIASNTAALGTLHVHDKGGEPTPSAGDSKAARMLRETIFVESRTGLYSVDPDGNVFHLFSEAHWFSKKCLK